MIPAKERLKRLLWTVWHVCSPLYNYMNFFFVHVEHSVRISDEYVTSILIIVTQAQ